MDIVDQPTRSRMMANIKTKGTKPEMVVRHLLHGAGFRYRLHRKDLPGCPDLVLPKYRAVIFVHGCFWHLHQGCPIVKIPTANKEFWLGKLGKNRARDLEQIKALNNLGWRVLVVWECLTRQKKSLEELTRQMVEWINGSAPVAELPAQAVGNETNPE